MLDRFNPADLPLPPALIGVPRLSRDGRLDHREVAEECAVALVYDGTTAAVVMAMPSDLPDLALGFGLTEGIIKSSAEIRTLEVVPGLDGIELRMCLAPRTVAAGSRSGNAGWSAPPAAVSAELKGLGEAARSCPSLSRSFSLTPGQIEEAVAALANAQRLNRTTRATHAADSIRLVRASSVPARTWDGTMRSTRPGYLHPETLQAVVAPSSSPAGFPSKWFRRRQPSAPA